MDTDKFKIVGINTNFLVNCIVNVLREADDTRLAVRADYGMIYEYRDFIENFVSRYKCYSPDNNMNFVHHIEVNAKENLCYKRYGFITEHCFMFIPIEYLRPSAFDLRKLGSSVGINYNFIIDDSDNFKFMKDYENLGDTFTLPLLFPDDVREYYANLIMNNNWNYVDVANKFKIPQTKIQIALEPLITLELR